MTRVGAEGLRWGIKRSFIEYVTRMPDGQAAVGSGACALEEGDLLFEPAPAEADDSDEVWRFKGVVRFYGHGGMLQVRLADPEVRWADDTGELTMVGEEDGVQSRVRMAELTVAARSVVDGVVTVTATPVVLAAEGVDLFGGVYPTGENLDPILISRTLA